MAVTSIDLCSQALMKIGAHPIASFDDGSAEAGIAASLYPLTRDMLLSVHPWNFATVRAALARTADAPLADFAYSFQLPNDCLRVLSAGAGPRSRGLAYRLHGPRLLTDADAVTVNYLHQAHESTFPSFFCLALAARLAAEFCLPITDSLARWKSLAQAAELELRRARLIDAQEETPPSIDDFLLVEGRG